MAGFKGNAENTLDGKGRLAIPAKLRKSLSEAAHGRFVATLGDGPYLSLYPADYWETRIEARMDGFGEFDPVARDFVHYMYSNAEDLTMDGQHRVALTKDHIEHAGLSAGSKATVVGARERLEIWEPSEYARNQARIKRQRQEQFARRAQAGSNPPAVQPTRP